MKRNRMTSIIAFIAISGAMSTVSANELGIHTSVTGVSNYIVKGMTQTSKKAAIQGDLVFAYGDFFAGVWASNVDFSSIGITDTDLEVDFFAGYASNYRNLFYSINYSKYTYDSKLFDDSDELRLSLDYNIDKFTIGAKYDIGMWNESDSKKLNYNEINVSYDFGAAVFSVAAGSFEDMGDNITVGLSKAGTFAGYDVEFRVKYADFNSDDSPSKDENNLWGEVTFSF